MACPVVGISLLVSLYVAPRVIVAFAGRSATPLGSVVEIGTAARLIWAFHCRIGYWLQGASRRTLLAGSLLSRTVSTQSVPSGFCEWVSGGTGAGLLAPSGWSL